MSEASGLAKIVLVLGVFAFLIAAIYPTQDTGWDNFNSTASSFPEFSNPFENLGYDQIVDIAGDWEPANSSSGCGGVQWECLAPPNEGVVNATNSSASYVRFHTWTANVSFRLGSYPSGGISVTRATLTMYCRNNDSYFGPSFIYGGFFTSDGSYAFADFGGINCPQTTYFFPSENAPIGFLGGCTDLCPSSIFSDAIFQMWTDYDRIVDVSFVEITLHIQGGTQPCAGALWDVVACTLGQFFSGIISMFQFLINALIFIGSAMIWLVQMAVSFFGIIGSAMSLPGIPAEIQTIIDVILIALVVMLVIAVFRIVRGSGSTG
jgi:hypothetical protein